MTDQSNLDLVNQVDSFPYISESSEVHHAFSSQLYTLIWEDSLGIVPLGYILAPVLEALLAIPSRIRGEVHVDREAHTVLAFTDTEEAERTSRIEKTFLHLKSQNVFPCLNSWKGETSPVYARDGLTVLYRVDRSVTGLLGVMRWGVHMTAYVVDESAPYGLKVWVAKRALTKSYPGLLDNAVAGGLQTGEDPLEGILREASEEANLPDSGIRDRTRSTGTVTYLSISTEKSGTDTGLIHPECLWTFDTELPAHVTPVPREAEVAEYRLYDVLELQEALAMGRFKPNCALVTIDFLMRHGVIDGENEPSYTEIKKRLHRELPFPGPYGRWAEN